MKKILVAGASGLIGGHLVNSLLCDGYHVRAVGRKEIDQWKQIHAKVENISLDLSLKDNCVRAVKGTDAVFNLAAEIGGVKFIEGMKAQTMLSVLINTHLLMAARDAGVKRYFYASAYAATAAETPQKEKALTDVIEDGHIWEKLFSEKLCKYFREDFGLETRIARLQNVYGTFDIYDGGRERAPAALCRKAAIAKSTGNHRLEIWGDGKQIRNFVYVTDAVDGIRTLTESNIVEPVRIGSEEFVTINQLVDAVEAAAGITFDRVYNTSAPSGTARPDIPKKEYEKKLHWQPKVTLKEGIALLYDWVEKDMKSKKLIP